MTLKPNSYRFVVSAIISFLLPILGLHAQTTVIDGHVSGESGPLSGVIVQGKSSEGKTLAYCTSDSKGAFSLKAGPEVQVLSFSLMGYTKVELKVPFSNPINVTMKESREALKASTVSTSMATVRNDTIRYTAAAVVQKEDKVLGDMLQRLPGIQVSETGRVTYNGIGINRLYVEGRNILDNDYHLATKNLDIKAIKAVNIYENHQPIKVLRNIVQTRSAALDIELEDNARDSWLLNSTLQGGYMDGSDIPYYGKATLMRVGGKSSAFAVADADATGHTTETVRKSEYASQDDIEDYLDISPLISTSLDMIDLDKSMSVFNHSSSMQTKDKFSIGDGTVIGVNARLSRDKASTFMMSRTAYSFPEMELNQNIDRTTEGTDIAAGISLEANKDKGYFRDDVDFMTRTDDGLSSMNGNMTLDEGIGLRKMDISNTINFAAASKAGSSVRGHVYTQYTQDSGTYSSTYDDLLQTYGRRVWWNRATINGSTRRFGNVRISFTPSASLYHGNLTSRNSGDIPESFHGGRENDITVTNANPEIAAGLMYQRQKFSSTMSGKMAYRIFDIVSGSHHSTTSVLSPSFVWFSQYKTPFVTNSLTATLTDDITSADKLGSGMIVTGFNTLRKGRDIPVRLPSIVADYSVNYSNPMIGLYSGLSLNASRRTMLTTNRVISGKYILTEDSDDLSSMNTLGGSISFSKGLYSLNGKVEGSVGYSNYWAQMFQNGIAYDYAGKTLTASTEWTLNPLSWLVLNNKTRFSTNTVTVAGVDKAMSNRKLVENFEMVFRLAERVSLNTSIDYFHNRSEQASQLVMANAAAVWMLSNGMNIFLKCTNLFNSKEYEYSSTGPLVESFYHYRIRPLGIMIGMDFSLDLGKR